ncbi:hypothetical protein CKM354_000045400 [Cercospora kikuchii]|uniref:Ribonucleases P/MRP subunit Pop8-like domain-containing protein n=1 Tax=Cercospora kikuchii TaxID=84275 RepID=A0A9P3FBW7_9PEZI|nr:uncharacterized protein CKM354_000045400 [Cercospora kikuchii]GIZ36990.1 hypothetical protein CKM354_000045400 [Cercospora kikuchii]
MADPENLPDAPASTPDAPQVTQPSTQPSSRQPRNATKNQTLSEFSIRKPDWVYVRLQHLSSKTNQSLDGVTAQLHLNAALSSFLGLHGSAIPIDILHLQEQDVWIRAPAEERAAIIAAVGSWISSSGEGWRVRGWSRWNANAFGRDAGQDLFD